MAAASEPIAFRTRARLAVLKKLKDVVKFPNETFDTAAESDDNVEDIAMGFCHSCDEVKMVAHLRKSKQNVCLDCFMVPADNFKCMGCAFRFWEESVVIAKTKRIGWWRKQD